VRKTEFSAPSFLSSLDPNGALDYIGAVPIYEFHCADCNRDSELLVPSTKWEGTPCPHCGSTRLAKKLSVFASTSAQSAAAPVCSGDPSSCDMCCPARPYPH